MGGREYLCWSCLGRGYPLVLFGERRGVPPGHVQGRGISSEEGDIQTQCPPPPAAHHSLSLLLSPYRTRTGPGGTPPPPPPREDQGLIRYATGNTPLAVTQEDILVLPLFLSLQTKWHDIWHITTKAKLSSASSYDRNILFIDSIWCCQ